MNKSVLYEKIANETKFEIDDIIDIFNKTEDIVFNYLANVVNGERRKVYIMNGRDAESKIVHRERREFPNGNVVENKDRLLLTAKISKRYRQKINHSR